MYYLCRNMCDKIVRKRGIYHKVVRFALILVMIKAINITVSGQSGKTGVLEWRFSDETLYISGNGGMQEYHYDYDTPWMAYRDSIVNVVIEEGVLSVGDHAFYGCENLKFVTLSNTVTSIGKKSFGECVNLVNIYADAVTNIGDRAFSYCFGLATVTIPKTIIQMGEDVFQKCYKLMEINVDEANTVYSSIDGVLFNKDKTRLIRYPEGKEGKIYLVPSSVKIIGDYAFCECGLEKVVISEPSIDAYRKSGGWKELTNIKAIE